MPAIKTLNHSAKIITRTILPILLIFVKTTILFKNMINLSKEQTKSDKSIDKKTTEKETEDLKEQMASLQNLLFAEKKHSLLIILQGMDAAGKDGTVKHVF